jgi:hypothetical protein
MPARAPRTLFPWRVSVSRRCGLETNTNTRANYESLSVQESSPIIHQVNKSGAQEGKGPQYLELFQPFKGNIELGFRNDVAQRIWFDCIEQLQSHLKRIEEQKAKLGGSEGKASEHALAQEYVDDIHHAAA